MKNVCPVCNEIPSTETYFVCGFELFLENRNFVREMYGIGRDSDGLMLSRGNKFDGGINSLQKMFLFNTVKEAKEYAKSVGLRIRR